MDLDRFPAADRSLGHRSRIPPDRVRGLQHRRIRRRHFHRGRDRAPVVLARGRDVHALSRHEAAAQRACHHDADPNAIYDTPMYRRLRAAVRWCVDHCVWVVGATVAAFVLPSSGSATSRSSSSRHPSAPSCSCSCGCRKAARSARPWPQRKGRAVHRRR